MAVKVKSVTAPSVSSIFMDWMTPARVTMRVSWRTRWAMPLGTPVMRKFGACRRGGELVEFLGELGVAEEEAERGAEVVELLGGGAGDLGVAGSVEPAEVAVEDEDFAGRQS